MMSSIAVIDRMHISLKAMQQSSVYFYSFLLAIIFRIYVVLPHYYNFLSLHVHAHTVVHGMHNNVAHTYTYSKLVQKFFE